MLSHLGFESSDHFVSIIATLESTGHLPSVDKLDVGCGERVAYNFGCAEFGCAEIATFEELTAILLHN